MKKTRASFSANYNNLLRLSYSGIHGFILVIVLGIVLSSCNTKEPIDEDAAEKCAMNFTTAFYNFDYDTAFKYCDSDSVQWLKMFVSNLQESDFDSIRNLTVRPTIKLVKTEGDDTSATAFCKVHNVYVLDTLGKAGHLLNKGMLKVQMKRIDKKWKVRTASLLQSEK